MKQLEFAPSKYSTATELAKQPLHEVLRVAIEDIKWAAKNPRQFTIDLLEWGERRSLLVAKKEIETCVGCLAGMCLMRYVPEAVDTASISTVGRLFNSSAVEKISHALNEIRKHNIEYAIEYYYDFRFPEHHDAASVQKFKLLSLDSKGWDDVSDKNDLKLFIEEMEKIQQFLFTQNL